MEGLKQGQGAGARTNRSKSRPRSRSRSKSRCREADAYKSPTQLFNLISDNAPTLSIVQHALNFPEEVKTWIVSRKHSKSNDTGIDDNAAKAGNSGDGNDHYTDDRNSIVWKYLPIHLVCLQQNPDKDLLLVMRDVYPASLQLRDHHGNLPIHYLLADGCNDEGILDISLDEEFKCLKKRDGEGMHILDIIRQSKASEQCRLVMERWFRKRDPQCTLFTQPPRDDISHIHTSTTSSNGASPASMLITRNDEQCLALRKELTMTRDKMKCLERVAEKFEWDCEAKDETIDSLTAQIMSLEKKISRMKEKQINPNTKDSADASVSLDKSSEILQKSNALAIPYVEHATVVDSNRSLKKEIEALKDKMKIDASIVSNQHDKIKQLETELNDANEKGKKEYLKCEKVQKQLEFFQGQVAQHDDAVAHIRKVSGILQDELLAKDQDIASQKKMLEAAREESSELKARLVANEKEAKKKLERFQEETRQQSLTLSQVMEALKKEKEQKQIMAISMEKERENELQHTLTETAARGLRFLHKGSVAELEGKVENNNRDTKRQQLLEEFRPRFVTSTADNSDEVIESATKSVQNEFCSRSLNESEASSCSSFDIRQRQAQLQEELRDIYAKIKAVLPSTPNENESFKLLASMERSKSDDASGSENNRRSTMSCSSEDNDILVKRRQREESRPWRDASTKKTLSDIDRISSISSGEGNRNCWVEKSGSHLASLENRVEWTGHAAEFHTERESGEGGDWKGPPKSSIYSI